MLFELASMFFEKSKKDLIFFANDKCRFLSLHPCFLSIFKLAKSLFFERAFEFFMFFEPFLSSQKCAFWAFFKFAKVCFLSLYLSFWEFFKVAKVCFLSFIEVCKKYVFWACIWVFHAFWAFFKLAKMYFMSIFFELAFQFFMFF